MIKRILLTGSFGQIGSDLTCALRKIYGGENVIATDLSTKVTDKIKNGGPFEQLDVLDGKKLAELIDKYQVDGIFHLAAILSAVGEKNPALAWNINMQGTINVYNVAREKGIKRIFTPSSMAAFGPTTPFDMTPQDTVLQPNTMYGITKVAGELLGKYYIEKYGMDIRGVRYPGIISNETLPGGGTTDYAVEIYYSAVKGERFVCPVRDVYMDMMYMPDALRAMVELMEADPARLRHRNSFNIASMSFTPDTIYAEIRKRIPDFEMVYDVDPVKQAIAESWPNKLDDSCAREEWGWKPEWDLSSMTDDMLRAVRAKNL